MASTTIHLLPDYTLTIAADGTGAGEYYELGQANEAHIAINNNDNIVLGPYKYLKSFRIVENTGTITVTKAFQNTMGFGADGGEPHRSINQIALTQVYNNTGGALSAGQVVYINGVSSGTPTVALAKADSPSTSPERLALVAEPIADTAYGYITTSGNVYSLDTSAHSVGDLLYLSAATAGALTATAPSRQITVAQVLADHASDGILFVAPNLEPDFDDLSGIDLSGASDDDVLQYDQSSGNWEPYTWSGTANQVTITFGDGTTTLSLPQDIHSGASPTFAGATINGNITITGTVDGVDVSDLKADVDGFPDALKNLTTAEINQLENIDLNVISNTQWSYLAALDQSVSTTSNVQFERITINGALYADDSDNTVGFFGATPVTQRSAIASLTSTMSDNTTNGVLEDVTGFLANADAAACERNFAEINAKLNSILTALRQLGLIAT